MGGGEGIVGDGCDVVGGVFVCECRHLWYPPEAAPHDSLGVSFSCSELQLHSTGEHDVVGVLREEVGMSGGGEGQNYCIIYYSIAGGKGGLI